MRAAVDLHATSLHSVRHSFLLADNPEVGRPAKSGSSGRPELRSIASSERVRTETGRMKALRAVSDDSCWRRAGLRPGARACLPASTPTLRAPSTAASLASGLSSSPRLYEAHF